MGRYNDAVAAWWVRNAEIRHGHLPRTESVVGDGKSWLLPALLGLVLGGVGVGVVPLALDLLSGDESVKSGSLYQYLEDSGKHLPDEQGLRDNQPALPSN